MGSRPMLPWRPMQRLRRRAPLAAALLAGSASGAAIAVLAPDCAAAQRPHVIVLIADDLGYGDLGAHGNPIAETPRLDALAAESARLDAFYVSPLCSPARAALLTGRHPLRLGVRDTSRGAEVLDPAEVTLAEAFAAAGYATAAFGKWHNGLHYPSDARGQGFAHFLGFRGGFLQRRLDPRLERDGAPFDAQGWDSDVFADALLAWLDRERERPAFAWVAFSQPHTPLQVDDARHAKYLARVAEPANAAVYGMIEQLDAAVGRILDGLEERGLAQRTLVVFLSDDGPSFRDAPRWNAGLAGAKGGVHEGSLRVPSFWRWPGAVAPRRSDALAADIDLYDTVLDLAGVPAPPGPPRDGRSLAALLRGAGAEASAERALASSLHGVGDSLRVPGFRYVLPGSRGAGSRPGLYELRSDPGETRDLSASRRPLARALRQRFRRWYDEVSRSAPRALGEPVPIALGHPEEPRVRLHAAEARLEGPPGLRYPRGGWDDEWVEGWTRRDQAVSWQLLVVRAGRYRALLRHAVSPAQLGSEMELRAGAQELRFRIERAAPGEIVPNPDRVPRREAPERRFGELALGEIELGAGRQRLSLRARRIAADSPLELHSLELEPADPPAARSAAQPGSGSP